MKVGAKVRQARKKLGLNMQEFAERLGVSYLTIHRVETDKVSPSVALLSDIAHQLGEPITHFFSEDKKFALFRTETAPEATSEKLNLKLLVPKGAIDENISVSLGSSQVGEFVSKHSHRGFELTYHIHGKCIFIYGSKEYALTEGDLIYFDSSVEHSVIALEPVQFLSIYFRK